MTDQKIMSLVNVSTIPKEVQKLLDEPITIIKGAEAKDFQALNQFGINKVKDLIQIKISSMIIQLLIVGIPGPKTGPFFQYLKKHMYEKN